MHRSLHKEGIADKQFNPFRLPYDRPGPRAGIHATYAKTVTCMDPASSTIGVKDKCAISMFTIDIRLSYGAQYNYYYRSSRSPSRDPWKFKHDSGCMDPGSGAGTTVFFTH